MSIGQEASKNYLGGFSCGEAVVKAARDHTGVKISPEAIKAASAFKTGIGACKGDICGCLAAALMVIGIKYGRDNNTDDITTVNSKATELYDKFNEKFGSLRCDSLTTRFRGDRQPDFKSQERKQFCSEIVGGTAELLEEILKD